MTKHGLYKTAEYLAWQNMKARCYRKSHNSYPFYGGCGVIVCAHWLHSFENFFADVGKRPSRKHSLDRFPDWQGDYTRDNVRWATKSQQMLNRVPSEKFLAAVRKNAKRARRFIPPMKRGKNGRFLTACPSRRQAR